MVTYQEVLAKYLLLCNIRTRQIMYEKQLLLVSKVIATPKLTLKCCKFLKMGQMLKVLVLVVLSHKGFSDKCEDFFVKELLFQALILSIVFLCK